MAVWLRNSVLTRAPKLPGQKGLPPPGGVSPLRTTQPPCPRFDMVCYNRGVETMQESPVSWIDALRGTRCPPFLFEEYAMNYATEWKRTESRRSEIAAQVKAEYRTRDAARSALIEQFARAYECDVVRDDEGTPKGFPKKGKAAAAAKKSLQRLLTMAFPSKPGEGRAKADPVDALVKRILAGFTPAQRRKIAAAIV